MTTLKKEVTIGILAYPGAQAAAVEGLVDLLETAQRLRSNNDENGPELSVRKVLAERSVPAVPDKPFTVLVLPPSLSEGAADVQPGPLTSFILDRHREGTLLCSVCAGAFLLGTTGLLSGRPATTHWALRDRFAERFPNVRLDTQKLLIDDGDIVTAGGVMAWIDLGLLLVSRFLGPTKMLATARLWVVDPGGREQRFYDCFAPVLTHGDEAILRVQHWLHAKRTERIDMPTMARVAKLGERTFLRRFHRATGHTPIEYLLLLRIERARELLERSTQSFDEIAFGLGYADPGSFRRVFVSALGLTPGEYRRRFNVVRSRF
ncbi:MAG TPA: helix-turn-helix domain-containing protein [Polyangium sp.]|nr:helix-turn-helix domain-containing protein [Polyangium sp.]